MTQTGDHVPAIYPAMANAMAEIKAVDKSRSNVEQKFKFRGIDEVFNEVHDCLAKFKIFTPTRVLERTESERQTKIGSRQSHIVIKFEVDFVSGEDGSKITAGPLYAEALDTSDKATNKAMSFGMKYALLQTFTIPTEDTAEPAKDGDNYNEQSQPTNGKPTWAIILERFAELKVSRRAIETALRHKIEEITQQEISVLKKLYADATNAAGAQRQAILSSFFGEQEAPAPQQQPAQRSNSAAERLNSRINSGQQ